MGHAVCFSPSNKKKEKMIRSRLGKKLKNADFLSSLEVDKNFLLEDIAGSIAHAKMLSKQNIISKKEGREIIKALNSLKKKKLLFDESLEDIHPNIEKFVTKITRKAA